jgi:hypothetical protein
MKINKLPPLPLLRELFVADPEAGTLARKSNGRTFGPLSGATIKGRIYSVSRILYAMYTGRDPGPNFVDHINRDRTDNRRCNLRALTAAENSQNKRSYSNTGYRGVHMRPLKDGTPVYRVQLHRKVPQIDGSLKPTTYHGGNYRDLEDAIRAAEELYVRFGTDLFVPVCEFHAPEVTPELPREAC